MLAIICNTIKEQDELIKRMTNVQAGVVNNTFVHTGLLNDVELVTCLSGEGKVNAAIVTTILITQLNVDRIIFIGKAKKIDDKVSDIIVADSIIQADLEQDINITLCKTDNSINELIKHRYPEVDLGLVITSDSNKTYPNALCIDSESGAIGTTCQRLTVPFSVIKSISDNYKKIVDIAETIVKDYNR